MAIQMRRGQLAEFDPDKMLPGEWAVSTDSSRENQHVYMCFAAGVVKRMATYEDFEDDMEAMSAAIQTANAAATAANEAVQEVQQIIAEKFGIDDTTPSTTTAYSSSKIENTFSKLVKDSKSNFPSVGNENTLYIDTSNNGIYFWNGTAYQKMGMNENDIVFASYSSFPDIGDTEKLYVDISSTESLSVYRWNGTQYVTTEAGDEAKIVYAAYASFPPSGESETLYIDNTISPALMYVWDADASSYIPAGGPGSSESTFDVTFTLPASGWTGSAAPYAQTVSVPGMTSGKAVVYAQVTSGAVPTNEEMANYELINGLEQHTDSVTFYAAEIPTTDLTMRAFCGAGTEKTSGTQNVYTIPLADFPTTGEEDVIYIDTSDTHYQQYIWDGTQYQKTGGTGNLNNIIESGTVTIASVPAGGNGYADITFTKEYDSAPVVIVTVQSTTSTNVIASCYNITDKGCRIYLRNNYTDNLSNVIVGYVVCREAGDENTYPSSGGRMKVVHCNFPSSTGSFQNVYSDSALLGKYIILNITSHNSDYIWWNTTAITAARISSAGIDIYLADGSGLVSQDAYVVLAAI